MSYYKQHKRRDIRTKATINVDKQNNSHQSEANQDANKNQQWGKYWYRAE